MLDNLLFKIVVSVLLIGGTAITISSCSKDKKELPCNKSLVKDSISFNKDLTASVFHLHCSLSGCHSGGRPAGNLNLEDSVAYSQLMKNGSGYIDTLNPNYSLLYIQMNSDAPTMPPSGKLDDCTINAVLQWIKEGAKNN